MNKMQIGDYVSVPDPKFERGKKIDSHNYGFDGIIVGFKDDMAQVRDEDDNVFDIEVNRLTVVQ